MPADVRPALALLEPPHVQHLPIDPKRGGIRVPWFVDWVDGVPEFRAMDRKKWRLALTDSLCWVCGTKLGRHRVFVLGPMCGLNRTTSEPPCHADCALWSARVCPFLSRPKMVRRDNSDLLALGAVDAPGFGLERNPGVTLLWWTRTYRTYRPASGNQTGELLEIGDAEQVRWLVEGRNATRADVVDAIGRGIGALREACDLEDGPFRREAAHAELERRLIAFSALYPKE